MIQKLLNLSYLSTSPVPVLFSPFHREDHHEWRIVSLSICQSRFHFSSDEGEERLELLSLAGPPLPILFCCEVFPFLHLGEKLVV